jgi:hypothetical protein
MEKLNDYDLSQLSPESEIDFKRCFVEDAATAKIRFTAKGFAVYGPRFAKAGIDINQIKNRDQLRDACVRSEDVWANDIREMVKGHKELEEILKPLWS